MSASPTSAAKFHPAALPARQGSLAGQGDAVQQQQVAWQREMERAQMANWFKPPVAGEGNVTVPSVRPPEVLARRVMSSAAQASGAIVGSNPAAVGSRPAMPLEPLAAGLRIGRNAPHGRHGSTVGSQGAGGGADAPRGSSAADGRRLRGRQRAGGRS
jgi:hypothetical protein